MLSIPSSKVELRRISSRILPTIAFIFFTLVFLRYLYSDNPPDRQFPDAFREEVCDGCFRYTYKRVLPPRVACGRDDVIDLVVLITTIPSQTLAREAIRATWANIDRKGVQSVRFLFLFGQRPTDIEQNILQEESKKYGDILQDDFEDNYYNLSLKVIMGYRWVMENCKQASFVMRTADDNYVNIPQVLKLLHARRKELNKYMIGKCYKGAVPFRWPFHKWVVSVREYPRILFPAYCAGTTFITSFTLTRDIINVSENIPFFPIEDVYFGMCMKQMENKYHVRTIEGFNLLPSEQQTSSDKCTMPKPLYSVHPVNIDEMLNIWKHCSPLEPS